MPPEWVPGGLFVEHPAKGKKEVIPSPEKCATQKELRQKAGKTGMAGRLLFSGSSRRFSCPESVPSPDTRQPILIKGF